MARQNAEFAIDQGPSKLDLMLSLFDTEMGARTVKFRVSGQLIQDVTLGWYDVQIISARRRHPSAKIWEIEGLTETDIFQEAIPMEPSEDLLLMLAIHLAKEMHAKNAHVILSYQDATPYLADMRSELGEDFLSVFLHTDGPKPSGHDHILPAKGESVNDLYQIVQKIILSA